MSQNHWSTTARQLLSNQIFWITVYLNPQISSLWPNQELDYPLTIPSGWSTYRPQGYKLITGQQTQLYLEQKPCANQHHRPTPKFPLSIFCRWRWKDRRELSGRTREPTEHYYRTPPAPRPCSLIGCSCINTPPCDNTQTTCSNYDPTSIPEPCVV